MSRARKMIFTVFIKKLFDEILIVKKIGFSLQKNITLFAFFCKTRVKTSPTMVGSTLKEDIPSPRIVPLPTIVAISDGKCYSPFSYVGFCKPFEKGGHELFPPSWWGNYAGEIGETTHFHRIHEWGIYLLHAPTTTKSTRGKKHGNKFIIKGLFYLWCAFSIDLCPFFVVQSTSMPRSVYRLTHPRGAVNYT